jgi:CopG family nickel-responsive transcriptional regulator
MPVTPSSRDRQLVRFSVSMPANIVRDLDRVAGGRGFANRSQCLASMIRECVTDFDASQDDRVMMGIFSLIYDHRKRNLQNRLTDLQHRYLKEIVTIQLVHLERDQSMQILLIQGPAGTLREIANTFAALKGVAHTHLQLNTTLLPPLHEPTPKGKKA